MVSTLACLWMKASSEYEYVIIPVPLKRWLQTHGASSMKGVQKEVVCVPIQTIASVSSR